MMCTCPLASSLNHFTQLKTSRRNRCSLAKRDSNPFANLAPVQRASASDSDIHVRAEHELETVSHDLRLIHQLSIVVTCRLVGTAMTFMWIYISFVRHIESRPWVGERDRSVSTIQLVG